MPLYLSSSSSPSPELDDNRIERGVEKRRQREAHPHARHASHAAQIFENADRFEVLVAQIGFRVVIDVDYRLLLLVAVFNSLQNEECLGAVRRTLLLAFQLQRPKDFEVDIRDISGEEVGHHRLLRKQLFAHDERIVVEDRAEDTQRCVLQQQLGEAARFAVAL